MFYFDRLPRPSRELDVEVVDVSKSIAVQEFRVVVLGGVLI